MGNIVNNGKTIFHDFYTEQQKRDDPGKENTGIFFFRGESGAPFARSESVVFFAISIRLPADFPHPVKRITEEITNIAETTPRKRIKASCLDYIYLIKICPQREKVNNFLI